MYRNYFLEIDLGDENLSKYIIYSIYIIFMIYNIFKM